MSKVIRVFAMLLVLAGAARAGEILSPPAPGSVKSNVVQETPVIIEDSSQEPPTTDEDTSDMTDALTQFALSVLLSFLP